MTTTQRATLQWLLGVAVSIIGLLITLGANAQLRRIDQLELRLLQVEKLAAQLSGQQER